MLDHLSDNAKHFFNVANYKYNEAEVLFREQHHIGGSYLIGYVIEMMLKAVLYEVNNETNITENPVAGFGNGHDIQQMSRGLLFLLHEFKEGEYRELLDIIEQTTYPQICAWSPDWRYHEKVQDIEADPDGFTEKLQEQVYELFLEMRFLLIDLNARRG